MLPLTFKRQMHLTKLSPLLLPCSHFQHFPHYMFNSLKYSLWKCILTSNHYRFPKVLSYIYLLFSNCLLYLVEYFIWFCLWRHYLKANQYPLQSDLEEQSRTWTFTYFFYKQHWFSMTLLPGDQNSVMTMWQTGGTGDSQDKNKQPLIKMESHLWLLAPQLLIHVSILCPHPPYKRPLENYTSLQTSSSDLVWRSLQQETCKSDHNRILEGGLKKGLSWESHTTSLQNGRQAGWTTELWKMKTADLFRHFYCPAAHYMANILHRAIYKESLHGVDA